jgi:hypothetical protein
MPLEKLADRLSETFGDAVRALELRRLLGRHLLTVVYELTQPCVGVLGKRGRSRAAGDDRESGEQDQSTCHDWVAALSVLASPPIVSPLQTDLRRTQSA